jgi:hypothetical protein
MSPPVDEIEIVLAWLRDLDRYMRELMPQSDGGDTSVVCRQAIDALEILRSAGWAGAIVP